MMGEQYTDITHRRTKEHWLKCALDHYAAERYQEALAACEHALTLDPSYARASLGKGVALSHLSRYEEALLACEQALTLDPGNAKAYHAKGNALYELQRYL
jgi:tetratricopeptide (TPR) repeat protein